MTDFKLNVNKALEEYNEAKALGIATPSLPSPGFQPISLLPKVLPVYKQLPADLKAADAKWIQVDEPVLDSAAYLEKQYASAYAALAPVSPKIALTTYYGRLDSNVTFVAKLPVAGLHIDLDPFSLGIVSGRNIWKADLQAGLALGQKAIAALGAERVVVATSFLLHTPVTLATENKLTAEQKDWFSFALEKATEVSVLASAISGSQDAAHREFERTSDDAARKHVASTTADMLERNSPFAVRKEQTEIRTARVKLNKKEITQEEYEDFIKKEMEHVVRFQERIGLDLLVHGEPERNHMIQYFGEQLEGFVFTQNGWVQIYSSRMLTGPVTTLNWSFPHTDVYRELQYMQLALALRNEVLPLRKADREPYLKWTLPSFKLATTGVTDSFQTHSHFCYSDFNDIFPSYQGADMTLLKTFKQYGYSHQISSSVYDVHSPRKKTEASLVNLVNAARWARQMYA
ncbi:UROD/MetE-like protein [Wolfiporia cocos MD-104 SS10]|uniref:5-methyltetrahydropteroyltriglutamate--homocysteine S-methyltransferase n=1 Tax=Wolfiporia cocos (strain MD-104) TaxID=742152 RepID=A0A2H3JBN0_WOLCO|nr:UROD/MetE-like protein [Wolfiporia cocos MD-104 SS10]